MQPRVALPTMQPLTELALMKHDLSEKQPPPPDFRGQTIVASNRLGGGVVNGVVGSQSVGFEMTKQSIVKPLRAGHINMIYRSSVICYPTCIRTFAPLYGVQSAYVNVLCSVFNPSLPGCPSSQVWSICVHAICWTCPTRPDRTTATCAPGTVHSLTVPVLLHLYAPITQVVLVNATVKHTHSGDKLLGSLELRQLHGLSLVLITAVPLCKSAPLSAFTSPGSVAC